MTTATLNTCTARGMGAHVVQWLDPGHACEGTCWVGVDCSVGPIAPLSLSLSLFAASPTARSIGMLFADEECPCAMAMAVVASSFTPAADPAPQGRAAPSDPMSVTRTLRLPRSCLTARFMGEARERKDTLFNLRPNFRRAVGKSPTLHEVLRARRPWSAVWNPRSLDDHIRSPPYCRMRARRRSTRLPWWFLLLGVLWAPGGAIAHGVAHQRQAADRAAHEQLEATADAHHDAASHASVESTDHHGEHDDIETDDGLPPRIAAALPAPARLAELPAVRFDTERCDAACEDVARPRGDPHTGPPPQLRAPPTV